jgi:hypothetical protein
MAMKGVEAFRMTLEEHWVEPLEDKSVLVVGVTVFEVADGPLRSGMLADLYQMVERWELEVVNKM